MTDSAPVYVIATALPKEGEMQTVFAAFASSQDRLKGDRDCLRFVIYEHRGMPEKLIFLEVWTSVQSHKAMVAGIMASTAFPAFREKLKEDIHFLYLGTLEEDA